LEKLQFSLEQNNIWKCYNLVDMLQFQVSETWALDATSGQSNSFKCTLYDVSWHRRDYMVWFKRLGSKNCKSCSNALATKSTAPTMLWEDPECTQYCQIACSVHNVHKILWRLHGQFEYRC